MSNAGRPGAPTESTITGRGASSVGVASIVAAVSAYVVLLVVARSLDVAQNSQFLVYWSLLFYLFGALTGVYQETTRAVGAGRDVGERGASVLRSGLLVGAVVAAAILATSWLWSQRVLGAAGGRQALLLGVAALLYAGHSALGGSLSGRREWHLYSALLSAESLVRLAVVVIVVAVAGSSGLDVAVVSGELVWLVLLVGSARSRAASRALADVALGKLLGNSGYAMAAAAASAALAVGFPVLLRATSDPIEWTTAAPLVLAITLTRAPLLIPLSAYQGVSVTYFVAHRGEGLRQAMRVVGLITGVGLVGAVAAYLVGPALLRFLFGPGYDVSGAILAGLTVAATLLALLTFSGSAVLAMGRHASYALGWLVAIAVSAATLLLPFALADRALLSLVLGPVAGLVVFAAVLAPWLRAVAPREGHAGRP